MHAPLAHPPKSVAEIESDFKRTINWNEYQSKKTNQAQNQYFYFLIDPCFQGVKELFVLSFKNENGRGSYKQYYLPAVKIKYCNVMIDGRNFFDQP